MFLTIMTIGKHRALSREVTCYYRLYVEIGQTTVKPIMSTKCECGNYRCIHTEDPITLSMVATGHMSRINARCLPVK